MRNDKRGVSGVIVTVLLILLVIAAIAILAVVVIPFIQEGIGEGTEGIQGCIDTGLEITEATTTDITVKRTRGSAEISEIKVIVGGSEVDDAELETNLGVGETASISGTFSGEVEVAAVIDGRTCDIADTATIA